MDVLYILEFREDSGVSWIGTIIHELAHIAVNRLNDFRSSHGRRIIDQEMHGSIIMKRLPNIIAILICLFFISAPAGAKIYKCIDADGQVTFTTKPGAGCTLLPGSAPGKIAPSPKLDYQEATNIVKKLACTRGGTVDEFLTKKAGVPAVEDLGWMTFPRKDGFEVERFLLLNNRLKLQYKWHVFFDGHVKPINGKAIGITASERN